jgi:hypothetical protein
MKNKIAILIIFVIVAGFYLIKTNPFHKGQNQKTGSPTETVTAKPIATLVLNDGETTATYSGIAAQNAFEALTVVTKKENIPLVTKQYDFGVFVQKIGEKESGTAMAWIYFINGKSGDVAADKTVLTTGDVVEWKYTKSIY